MRIRGGSKYLVTSPAETIQTDKKMNSKLPWSLVVVMLCGERQCFPTWRLRAGFSTAVYNSRLCELRIDYLIEDG